MPTLAEVTSHQSALLDLTTLAQSELVKFWRSLDLTDPVAVAVALRELMPDLFAAYGTAAGTLAADFYDELRAQAAVAGVYAATMATLPPSEAAQSLVGWGLAPLFFKDEAEAAMLAEEYGVKVDPKPAPNPDLALSRLAGGLQRAVAGADRQTIITNARSDPQAVRYARHASASACAFCALLATRQADYRTKESAVRVTGEIDPRNPESYPLRGPRGPRKLGEKYHDYCHCVAVPVWPGDEVEEAPYVADWREAYYAATEKLGGATKPKAILAEMRQTLGTN